MIRFSWTTVFICAAFLMACLFSCDTGPTPKNIDLSIDLSGTIQEPRHYVVPITKIPLTIDGIASEAAWKSVDFTEDFVDISNLEKPRYRTRCKMLWDTSFLYVFAQLEDEHIWGDIKERDQIIYFNNDFEVFIDPNGSGAPYAEIEINALGTVWDLLLNKTYRVGGKAIFDWNLDRLKSAVYVNGSLNNPSDLDSFWSVELAIPLKSISHFKHPSRIVPEEGEQWSVNFSRVQWQYELKNGEYQRKKDKGKYLKEDNWVWSPQGVVNMHEPEKWGFIQFSHKQDAIKEGYIPDVSLRCKQGLYALFREIRFGSLKEEFVKDSISRIIRAKTGENEHLLAFYQSNNFGFSIEANCPFSSKTFIINQDGQLKEKL